MNIQQSPQNSINANLINAINENSFFLTSQQQQQQQHEQKNSSNESTNLAQMGVINSNSVITESKQSSVNNNPNTNGLGGGHIFLNLNNNVSKPISNDTWYEQNVNNNTTFFADQQKHNDQRLEENVNKLKFFYGLPLKKGNKAGQKFEFCRLFTPEFRFYGQHE